MGLNIFPSVHVVNVVKSQLIHYFFGGLKIGISWIVVPGFELSFAACPIFLKMYMR